jgi:hypothetical protein
MIDLFLVGIRLVIRFADTLRDDFRIAFAMARVFAISALHASSVF